MNLLNHNIFRYLREVAEYVSLRTEDGVVILSKQYEKLLCLNDDSVACLFLQPENLEEVRRFTSDTLIFPFGCNESQYEAVNKALNNRISVIEGPPGTGKTQTILNIIANLILADKTVQIVSNNNSAIENIVEKLGPENYSMDFFVALLGKRSQKKHFLESQNGLYPDIRTWKDTEQNLIKYRKDLSIKSKKIQEIFANRKKLAILKQELSEVLTEQKHYFALNIDKSERLIKKSLASRKILILLQEYQEIKEGLKNPGIIYKIISYFRYGINMWGLLNQETSKVVVSLQKLYYDTKINELNARINAIEKANKEINADMMINEFVDLSLKYLRSNLASKYAKDEKRPVFSMESLWKDSKQFLKEYPVVLSTTYTARSSLNDKSCYDYVIMDESSQVDIATGFLALSSAKNAVIVGDMMQLPNIVNNEQKADLLSIFKKYKMNDSYNCAKYSFMESVCNLMNNAIPRTLLIEHYRCHPQIIGFCNKKFYDGKLVVMNSSDDNNALNLYTTVMGSHERDHMNQRQIDIIKREILPSLKVKNKEIGIIAPYRNQIRCLQKEIHEKDIDISTVHKFQGREKDVIILSLVDDVATSFSDDSNLLNVAISRAKKKLIVVASGQEQPKTSNISDLIGYIKYNNCDIRNSKISSVFDYLYKEYANERAEYFKKHGRISEYDSENLMYALINEEIRKLNNVDLDIVCHQPLNLLILDKTMLSQEEVRYVSTGLSHIDFLIYNRVSKIPVLAIEVDGYRYHKEGTKQAERDKLKDHILELCGIPLLRFVTNGSEESKIISSKLGDILKIG